MTDTAITTLTAADTTLDALRARPTTVAEALERCARIDAMTEWLATIRGAIRDTYLTPMADTTEAATGGRFSVPVNGLGSVYRTKPEPKPYVADTEALGRWYVTEQGEDPDAEPEAVSQRFSCDVVRTTTATAPADALLAFLNAHAADPWPDGAAQAANALADRISVDVEWLLPAGLVDDLIAGKVLAAESGVARAKVVDTDDGPALIDTTTGATIPGAAVKPAARPQLTVKPDAAARQAIAAELIELLGPPALAD